jgi:hypothetical protein
MVNRWIDDLFFHYGWPAMIGVVVVVLLLVSVACAWWADRQ